jgi:O-antigen/teichoic acid export membrane protein
MTTKVVKGSLWTLVGQVLPLGVSLVTTPFVIRMLGAESYGVLILVGLIPTYLGFADFGMGLASTKFASEAYAEGDPAREARIVRTAALIALLSSLPIALVLFLFSSRIISLFNVPEHLHAEASLALKLAAITFVVSFLNNIFNTPQLARLRMDLNTLVNAGFRILGLVATPFAIFYFGIVGAVTVLLIAGLLTLIGHLFFSNHLDKHLFETGIERNAIQPMLKFGMALVSLGVAGVILINAEKGIVAASISVKSLAYYSVAATMANMMVLASNTIIQSLVPAFAQLVGESRRSRLEALFSQMVKLILIGTLPAAIFFFVASRDLVRIWAGTEFSTESTLPFRLLLIGLIFSVPGYVPYSLLMARARADMISKLYWLEVIPYLFLVSILTNRFGIAGTAAAWGLRVAFDGVLFFLLARRTLNTGFRALPPQWKWLAGATVFYTPAILGVNYFTEPFAIGNALLFGIGTIFYCLIVVRFVISNSEWTWFKNVVFGTIGLSVHVDRT